MRKISLQSQAAKLKKYARWEFWPRTVFNIPVVVKYVALAVRYRSLSLPMLANPGMHTGGLIGESKYQTLADLARSHSEFVAETYYVPFRSAARQMELVDKSRGEHALEFPLVFKPDVGQRGEGFKVIHSEEEAAAYVKYFARDFLIQKYVPGPFEAEVFYYRYPNEPAGRIFAITEKRFPTVTGDGRHTLEELIRRDGRASLLADVFLERFAAERRKVPAEGERVRLVEAGDHCQGAIFLDGHRLYSAELEAKIDEISRSVRGFFVGRYDIRYASEESFRQGRDFRIVELNGISSEATSIYDPRNTLWSAYRTLFRQWEIIFAIADQNRRRGLPGTPLRTVWRNWARYRREAGLFPVSD
jgi:hypothetical protein